MRHIGIESWNGIEYLGNSIFVANLSQRFSNCDLAWYLFSLFKQFGLIKSIKASRDGLNRPFGFVQFYSSNDCDRVFEVEENKLDICGRPIRIERARRQFKIILNFVNPTENAIF